jgi:hypothetical protein
MVLLFFHGHGDHADFGHTSPLDLGQHPDGDPIWHRLIPFKIDFSVWSIF